MKRFSIFSAAALFLIASTLVSAQTGAPRAMLEYFEDPYELTILTPSGEIDPSDLFFGFPLEEGTTIRTNGTFAELRLDPNGSAIKLAPHTVFSVDNLQRSPQGSNNFSLVTGRMRAIAARGAGAANYRVHTPSAVAGVRGTDFGIEAIPGSKELAFVISGTIDYTSTRTNQTVRLTRGMAADALAESFEAARLSQLEHRNLLQELTFEALKPEEVPGYEQPGEAEEIPEETADADESGPEAADGEAENLAETPETALAAEDDRPGTDPAASKAAVSEEDGLLRTRSNLLGLQIGTITIKGSTYSKGVILPQFTRGRLKLGLYLPIIYTNDLFDPDSWYRPRGNNEWSFGLDQSDSADMALDFLSDLMLKIQYIEWGKQGDPFFLKVGNLNNITLGHGLIMRNFANDADFPAIRRVGLNLGIDFGRSGFETVVNDLSNPGIFGGRLYFRPFGGFPLALGISAAADFDPLSGLPADNPPVEYRDIPGDTVLLAAALDLDFPLLESDHLSLIFFTDLAGLLPYMDGSLQTAAFYDDSQEGFSFGKFKNYGLASGFFGKFGMIDYSLETRYFTGAFRPAFFDSTYERLRAEYTRKIYQLRDDGWSGEEDKKIMGIFGSLGFTILDSVGIKAAYMWPWSPGAGFQGEEDEFHLTLRVYPEVIPVTGLYGAVNYSRRNFMPTLTGGDFHALLDANTTLSGEIIYPVTPNLEIAGIFGTTLSYESDGTLKYDSSGMPEVVPQISIETRVRF